MSEKSEAEVLADALTEEHPFPRDIRLAAAELRRLHEKCEALTADIIEEMGRIVEIRRLTAQRDALLEALRRHVELHDEDCICEDCAAIKMVEEGR